MSRHHPSPLFRPSRLALLLAVSYPCMGWADGALTLDPVVVTGSRVETRSFDLPAAIEVVDAARINADQARVNASEALAGVPGISVANRQNYAQDLQISSRGFGARSAFGVRGVRLVADGIRFRLTLSISPPLIAMLRDPFLQQRFLAHLSQQSDTNTCALC